MLKPGGRFCFASDIDTYVNWTLLKTRAHAAFDWPAESSADWLTPYPTWPSTRYEAKAKREGKKLCLSHLHPQIGHAAQRHGRT